MTERRPDRAGSRMRDMIGAVVVLVVIAGAVMGYFGACSFSPGGPSVDPSSAPSVNAASELAGAARSVTFPVRRPAVPADWRANSAATAAVGAGADGNVVVRVGWVTPSGYVQLSQSGGAVDDVLVQETGQEDPPAATGSVEVGEVTWTTYPARRDEPAWVTELDGTVLLVTGSAPEEAFRRLATATQEATPLAR